MILGPREGEFLASDQNGKVDQKPTEPSPRPFNLNRASTFAPRDSFGTSRSRRISFINDAPEQTDKTSRRRSATLSTLGWASNANRRTLSLPKVPLGPTTETEEQRKSRRTSLLPLTLQAGPSAPAPLSNGIDYSNNTSRTPSRSSSLRSQRSNHSLNSTPPPSRERRESSGNFQSDTLASQHESIPEEPQKTPRVPMPVRRPRPVSCYADACVQTEVVEEEDEPDTPLASYQARHHLRGRSSVSSASSVFSAGSDFSSRRTSVASDFKVDDGNCWAQEPVLANPICMGRMQDYFRATSYQLGDAFTAAGNTYWGSWRQ